VAGGKIGPDLPGAVAATVVVVVEVEVTVAVAGESVVDVVCVLTCVFGTVVVVEANVKTVEVEVLVVVRVSVLVVQEGVFPMQEQAVLTMLGAALVSDTKAAGTDVVLVAALFCLSSFGVIVSVCVLTSVEVMAANQVSRLFFVNKDTLQGSISPGGVIVSVMVINAADPDVTVSVVVEEAAVMNAVAVIVFVLVAPTLHVGTAIGYFNEQYSTAGG
jgi:hypothetical protein